MKHDTTIFGIRAIIEAIKAGKEIDKIIIRKGQDNALTKELLADATKANIPLQFVPIEKIDFLCKQNHQGALAIVSSIEYQNIEQIIPLLYENGKLPFILVLDEITDVRNFGAICRSAECAGVDAVVIPLKGMAPINADSIKTSAGALTKIPVCRVASLNDCLKFLKLSGIKTYAITEKTDNLYYGKAYNEPVALIVGSEEFGISTSLLKQADELIKIPMMGTIESLNASVAASILLFEVVRQRQD